MTTTRRSYLDIPLVAYGDHRQRQAVSNRAVKRLAGPQFAPHESWRFKTPRRCAAEALRGRNQTGMNQRYGANEPADSVSGPWHLSAPHSIRRRHVETVETLRAWGESENR